VDADLERRLRFFEDQGQVDADLCQFVRSELELLASAGVPVTEETAGMFATHLLMALQRVRAGEPVEVPDSADLIAVQLQGQEAAVAQARELAARGESDHQVVLPPHEVDFIALHIATLRVGQGGSGGATS
jgi:antitoxin (DNA-binding transcriptional repressor) of toxin-antitoxin stability system